MKHEKDRLSSKEKLLGCNQKDAESREQIVWLYIWKDDTHESQNTNPLMSITLLTQLEQTQELLTSYLTL